MYPRCTASFHVSPKIRRGPPKDCTILILSLKRRTLVSRTPFISFSLFIPKFLALFPLDLVFLRHCLKGNSSPYDSVFVGFDFSTERDAATIWNFGEQTWQLLVQLFFRNTPQVQRILPRFSITSTKLNTASRNA